MQIANMIRHLLKNYVKVSIDCLNYPSLLCLQHLLAAADQSSNVMLASAAYSCCSRGAKQGQPI